MLRAVGLDGINDARGPWMMRTRSSSCIRDNERRSRKTLTAQRCSILGADCLFASSKILQDTAEPGPLVDIPANVPVMERQVTLA